jgi:hypothetical protein
VFCGGMIPDHPGWIVLDDDVEDGWFTEEEIQTQERMYGGEESSTYRYLVYRRCGLESLVVIEVM